MENIDGIMRDTTSGLMRDPDRNIPYLMQRIEEYRDNAHFREIARTCGRIMWEILPEDKKANLIKMKDEHSQGTEEAIQEALANPKGGEPQKILAGNSSGALIGHLPGAYLPSTSLKVLSAISASTCLSSSLGGFSAFDS